MLELILMSYEVLDHTADLCIRVTGKSFGELLRNAALAMMDLLADREGVDLSVRQIIEVGGETKEELLVKLLSEILYLHETSKLVFRDIRLEMSDETRVAAELSGEIYDCSKHELVNDIKAVTYHGLKVKSVDDKFTADIVFDI